LSFTTPAAIRLARLTLSRSSKARAEVAAAARLVLQASDLRKARQRLAAFSERFAKTASKAAACLAAAFDDALAAMARPEKCRRRLRSTNLQERKYLDRDECHEWLAARREGAQVVALTSG